MMLAMVNLHGLGIYVWFEGGEVVGKGRKSKSHYRSPDRSGSQSSSFNGCSCAIASRPASPDTADDAGQDRNEHHDHHDDLDVLIDARNIVTEEIPDAEHAPDPGKGTQDIGDEECSKGHAGNTRGNRGEGADHGHELG